MTAENVHRRRGFDDSSPSGNHPIVSRVRLFGIPIEVATLSSALDRVHSAIVSRERLQIGVVNAAKIVNMQRNPTLSRAVRESDAIYADGMSVVWASRFPPTAIAGACRGHRSDARYFGARPAARLSYILSWR